MKSSDNAAKLKAVFGASTRRPKGKRRFVVSVEGAGGSVSRSQMRRSYLRLVNRKS